MLEYLHILVLLYHLNHCLFYCDYFYQTNGTKYATRGGRSDYGFSCGAFFTFESLGDNINYWGRGASLSFKPVFIKKYIVIVFIKVVVQNMLFVVVQLMSFQ